MADPKPNPKALTTAAITSASPGAKPYELSDGASGLRVNISPTGTKSFRWYLKDKGTGKNRKITLGTFPAMSLGAARTRLGDLKDAHAGGTLDQVVESRRKPKVPDAPARVLTVRDFAADFMGSIERRRERPEPVKDVLDKDILRLLGDRPVASITPEDVARVVEDVVDRGAPSHAGKVLQVAKQLFRFAQSRGKVSFNPASSLDADDLGIVNRKCDRYLSSAEIEQFWKALGARRGITPTVRDALRLLLLLGVRSGELLQATWDEIDLEAALWTIPVAHQKLTKKQKQDGAKPFRVPLPPTAIAILGELRAFADSIGSRYVVASFAGAGAALSDKALNHAMRRLFDGESPSLRFEGERPTPHDLRRTMRTHLAKLRVPPYVAERCLNHSLGRIFKTYTVDGDVAPDLDDNDDFIEERRKALARWDARVMHVVSGKGAEVVGLNVQAVRS